MAWEHLDINKPHLVYIILGGFTSLFMLCSSVIKERLYIGEATVATICGIIFGPHVANLINPGDWGNTDQITLEFSRIVLVVQCFAVGVELPRAYMERHWRSVTLLLVPIMTVGWLITSLFIWWMFRARLDWLDSLCIAACVTATDPVLASSVVGKGKFAKRVPKHLRDLLSAESGCNDGMAFPFIYLSLYLIRYRPHTSEVAFHWICITILYECVFGAIYGVLVGYAARRAIRYAHEKDWIDRESFLVFYFVLALFCAGSGSILGMDDLLIGFACGVGFSNDGWFLEKTEESHVSNVIDLLINLAFFVYFGTIIPWEQFNSAILGTTPWRLVVVAVFVIFFRRIPIMMLLKPIIPDIKTWREALFAGHFGPIGVGAIFVAILARAELEHENTTPLAVLPEPGFAHMNIIELIWPITTFLVVISIVVHGSSIAVFTLGKRINTLTLTLSYTQADDGPSWMERIPRIQSRSKSSMSLRRNTGESETSLEVDEKGGDNYLSPVTMPKDFLLRRQKEDDDFPARPTSKSGRRRRRWDQGIGPGGPVSQSAISPASRRQPESDRYRKTHTEGDPSPLASDDSTSPQEDQGTSSPEGEPQIEIFQEGDKTIIEDEEGNVLRVRESNPEDSQAERQRADNRDARRLMEEKDVQHGVAQTEHEEPGYFAPQHSSTEEGEKGQQPPSSAAWWKQGMERLASHRRASESGPSNTVASERRRGPARAYTFGNTVIVEDEDGEVIKQYQIPNPARLQADRKASIGGGAAGKLSRELMQKMGYNVGGNNPNPTASEQGRTGRAGSSDDRKTTAEDDDHNIRFTMSSGRRLKKHEFIEEIQKLDPKARARLVEDQDAPEGVKREIDRKASATEGSARRPSTAPADSRSHSSENLQQVESIPSHPVAHTLAHFGFDHAGRETAAQRRRRLASPQQPFQHVEDSTSESESDPEPRDTPRRSSAGKSPGRPGLSTTRRASSADAGPISAGPASRPQPSYLEEAETEAEKRRRQAALGLTQEDDSSDDEEGTVSRDRKLRGSDPARPPVDEPESSAAVARGRRNIRFAETEDSPRSSVGPRLRWGDDVGRRP
jgi:NhaP-type Na+/H+ or K+/H+ antiporter